MSKPKETLNPFEIARTQIDRAGKKLNLDAGMLEILKNPRRELTVHFPVKMDDGTVKVFTGYRVQYNDAVGPFKGGIRYHWNVSLDEVRAPRKAASVITPTSTSTRSRPSPCG